MHVPIRALLALSIMPSSCVSRRTCGSVCARLCPSVRPRGRRLIFRNTLIGNSRANVVHVCMHWHRTDKYVLLVMKHSCLLAIMLSCIIIIIITIIITIIICTLHMVII
jgi:hypothetical protein